MVRNGFLIVLGLTLALNGASEGATISGARYGTYPDRTRIVFDLDSLVPFKVKELRAERKVSVILENTSPSEGAPTTASIEDGLVKTITMEVIEGGTLATIELVTDSFTVGYFQLPSPPRVVLDIWKGKKRSFTIVLDPGHGGHDPGAKGPTGLREKDVTLDIAKRVAEILFERTSDRIILTRSDDRFVGLRDRAAIANENNADMFVSIHVNAAPSRTARGVETFYQSVSLVESSRLLEKLGGSSYDPKGSAEVSMTIESLLKSKMQKGSVELAISIQDELSRELGVENRGVKEAMFVVLRNSEVPAVLVEVGFISNPSEEKKLRSQAYRDRIAKAIASGIIKFRENAISRGEGSQPYEQEKGQDQ